MEQQSKEKKIPITIRLPASRVELIRKMAQTFGVSTAYLAATMLETGFVIVDELEAKGSIDLGVFNG